MLCVESAAKKVSENQKNSTVTDNNTISLSLSEEEPVETLKDSVDTSSQVNYCLLVSFLGFGFWFSMIKSVL